MLAAYGSGRKWLGVRSEQAASGVVMSQMDHFRLIQRGFGMSVIPQEADIRTAGAYEYTP